MVGSRVSLTRRFSSIFTLLLLPAFWIGCRERADVPPPLSLAEPVTAESRVLEYPKQWLGPKNLTVAPGVHVLAGLYPSAVFAIETDQGILLIDGGVEENAYGLRECLLQVGLRMQDVRIVLVTHAHYDHVFGINKVREVSGAMVCAGRGDSEVLMSADQDSLFSLFPRHPYSGKPIPIDRELQDGDVVELGTTKIQVLGTPGHTPGSLCFLLERDGQRILFSGDTIASLNYGPAIYPARLAPRYRGDARAFLESIERLLQMGPPDLLLTSHPRQQTRRQSICLDHSSWRQLLSPAAEELKQLIARHKQDGADFLDGTTREIEAGLCYLGELEGTAVYGLISGDQLVIVNAPGGSDFASFLDDALDLLGWEMLAPSLVLLTSTEASSHSGLNSLPSSVPVVCPPSLVEALRADGVRVVPREAWGNVLPQEMEVIAIDDLLSYQFNIDSKRVLITPGVPRQITLVWTDVESGRKLFSGLQPQTKELMEELYQSPDYLQAAQRMLHALEKVSPDIWLPAIPAIGQNANLYDEDWSTVIQQNLAETRKVSDLLRDGP